jgi:hypothetical protein
MDPQLEPITNFPFFFILGRPRSGTTLLRSIFDAHPSVNIPPEHINMIHLYFKYRFKTDRWNKKDIDQFYTDFSNHNAIKILWKLDDEKVKEQLYNLTGEKARFADLIRIIYYNYQSLNTKEKLLILGDKSPVNSLYSKTLLHAFPDARFIHLVRDYRGNLASMLKYDVFSPSVTTIVSQWKKSVKQIEALANIYPERFFTLKYEDLVADPLNITIELCRFLNIPYDPVLLDTKKREEVIIRSYGNDFINEWHPNLQKEISAENITKWKQKLNSAEICQADFIVGKTAEKYGYISIYSHFSLGFRFISFLKILAFYNREVQRHIFDQLPYKWKEKIRSRKFILSKEIIILYRRIFGRK